MITIIRPRMCILDIDTTSRSGANNKIFGLIIVVVPVFPDRIICGHPDTALQIYSISIRLNLSRCQHTSVASDRTRLAFSKIQCSTNSKIAAHLEIVVSTGTSQGNISCKIGVLTNNWVKVRNIASHKNILGFKAILCRQISTNTSRCTNRNITTTKRRISRHDEIALRSRRVSTPVTVNDHGRMLMASRITCRPTKIRISIIDSNCIRHVRNSYLVQAIYIEYRHFAMIR